MVGPAINQLKSWRRPASFSCPGRSSHRICDISSQVCHDAILPGKRAKTRVGITPSLVRGLDVWGGYADDSAGTVRQQTRFEDACLGGGLWVFSGSSAMADGAAFEDPADHGQGGWGLGTLSYGGYALYPGYSGLWPQVSSRLRLRRPLLGGWQFRRLSQLWRDRVSAPAPAAAAVRENLAFSLQRLRLFSPSTILTPPRASARLWSIDPSLRGSDRPDMNSGYPYRGDFGPFTGAFPIPKRSSPHTRPQRPGDQPT